MPVYDENAFLMSSTAARGPALGYVLPGYALIVRVSLPEYNPVGCNLKVIHGG